jgi:hypothetical protein
MACADRLGQWPEIFRPIRFLFNVQFAAYPRRSYPSKEASCDAVKRHILILPSSNQHPRSQRISQTMADWASNTDS